MESMIRFRYLFLFDSCKSEICHTENVRWRKLHFDTSNSFERKLEMKNARFLQKLLNFYSLNTCPRWKPYYLQTTTDVWALNSHTLLSKTLVSELWNFVNTETKFTWNFSLILIENFQFSWKKKTYIQFEFISA